MPYNDFLNSPTQIGILTPQDGLRLLRAAAAIQNPEKLQMLLTYAEQLAGLDGDSAETQKSPK